VIVNTLTEEKTRMPAKKQPHLAPKEIERAVLKRLKPYDKLSFLEQFAMFMGKAQVLEFGLKGLLARRFGSDFDKMERWTLGQTAAELKKKGLRKDFVALLESLVQLRNLMAHDLLVSEAIMRHYTGRTTRASVRPLEHGIYELERILFLHDWIEEHGAWVLKDATEQTAERIEDALRADDGASPETGVVATLMAVDGDTCRLIMNDVRRGGARGKTSWKQQRFFTHKDLNSKKLNNLTLTPDEYRQIGENLLVRILALNPTLAGVEGAKSKGGR
jgi:hypothetical protein